MIRRPAMIVLSGLACAFLLGWLFPDRPESLSVVRRGLSYESTPTLRPGESTVTAVAFLRTLRSDPLPPPPPPPPPPLRPPPAPPAPDVSVLFKADLKAIMRNPETNVLRVLVRDPDAPDVQTRGLIIGDRYMTDWLIKDISPDTVTLGNGRDVRVVRLYS